MRVGVIHGPNLNLLGSREPDLYGSATLAEVESRLVRRANELGIELVSVQSNHEGVLVDFVQAESGSVGGWLVNAAGYTHTSVALRDALAASGRPLVEVHLTNILAREPFRRDSLLAPIALGVIAGFGERSYTLGLQALAGYLDGAQ